MSWLVIGRVLPERAAVNFGPLDIEASPGGDAFPVRLEVKNGHALVSLKTELDLGVFVAADIFRHVLSPIANYIGIQNRGGYILVADVVVSPDGLQHLCPINDPTFEPVEARFTFRPVNEGETIALPLNLLNHASVRGALHALAQATRYSLYTFMYCRIAIESVRSFYDPEMKRGTAWSIVEAAGEKKMCSVLNLDRAALKGFLGHAAILRHGRELIASTWQERKDALELSYEIANRHILSLDGADTSSWETILEG